MSRYHELIVSGGSISHDVWAEHVLRFHESYPGVSSQQFRLFSDGERAPYEAAAQELVAYLGDHDRVLEAGCGSGELLAAIHALAPGTALTGVDVSPAELAIAKARVPFATLKCGDIAALAFTQRYDCLVSHVALSSMVDIRAKLRLFRQLLAPGAVLLVVNEYLEYPSSIFAEVGKALMEARTLAPLFSPVVPARGDLAHGPAFDELLVSAGFTIVDSGPRLFRARLTPQQLWNFARSTYVIGLLNQEIQTVIRGALLSSAADKRSDEVILPLRFIFARAA